MINRVIDLSLANRLLVILASIFVAGAGVWAVFHTAVDAIPDLSENQVIVFTDWPGRSPQEVEDQITYPLTTNLQGLAGVRTVRASSMFGFSMITVIFEDSVDLYFARTRVLERLSLAKALLPAGIVPTLGPDATGLGWIFEYYLDAPGRDLGELRALQDFFIRYQLQAVAGVAEVGSIGGFARQYQVDIDPARVRAYGLTFTEVMNALLASNRNVGGKVIEEHGRELIVRGVGLFRGVSDIEDVVIDSRGGTPVLVRNVATVALGPDFRRGALDCAGAEVVGGVVVMRMGEDVLTTIQGVKARIEEISKGLPPGVKIVPFYDRTGLIERAIATLSDALHEEIVLVVIAHILFLLHFRSILIVSLPLPLAILISFLLMKIFGISSNIMSLCGIAMAIGMLVDAGIVVTENAFRHLEGAPPGSDLIEGVREASHQVGRPIFFAMLIIILAFVPVFWLTGQEGKLFFPLALTKTFAMIGTTILSVTLVPVLCTLLIRGRLMPEERNPFMRVAVALYRPILAFCLRFRWATFYAAALLLLYCATLVPKMGSEFMPPLEEGDLLFMPTMLPSVSLSEALGVMQKQDMIIRSFPEVARVTGKLGRAETATDPAPIGMFETVVNLKPESEWRPGMTRPKLIEEMNGKLANLPGIANGWTQPIQGRLDMLATGIRTQIGIKIFGSDLPTLERLASDVEAALKTVPGAADLFFERALSAPYLDLVPDPVELGRYGLRTGDVLDVVERLIGGENLTVTIEGRNRYPVRVRFAREFRDSIERLLELPIPIGEGARSSAVSPGYGGGAPQAAGGGDMGMGGGAAAAPQTAVSSAPRGTDRLEGSAIGPSSPTRGYVPLRAVARAVRRTGPAMIGSENGLLRAIVQANVRNRDLGSFVTDAKAAVEKTVTLPPGYFLQWSGQWENQVRARKQLMMIVPISVFVIFVLLFITYGSLVEAAHVILAVPFALTGGLLLVHHLGFNWSVAVWVGFITLFGEAIQTGMVMVVYLEEAIERRGGLAAIRSAAEILEAVTEGALLRLRPKFMTVGTTVAGLLPIMWATGTGSEVMRPIAAPVLGGTVSSLIHVLVVTPAIYVTLRTWEWRKLHPGPHS